jgi:predicted O-methyltransferase YrrM
MTTPQNIILNKDAINQIDLSELNEYVDWHTDNFQYFNMEAGKEHYKVLAYISKVLNMKKLIDIGTYLGFSSVALSYNHTNKIHSYDIFDWLPEDKKCAVDKSNITLHISDYMSDIPEIIKDCEFILIDIDHTGATERIIMAELRKAGYKGLVMIDDIKLNQEMVDFYNEIPEKKIDISSVSHWSGSAIIIMDPSRYDIQIEL